MYPRFQYDLCNLSISIRLGFGKNYEFMDQLISDIFAIFYTYIYTYNTKIRYCEFNPKPLEHLPHTLIYIYPRHFSKPSIQNLIKYNVRVCTIWPKVKIKTHTS